MEVLLIQRNDEDVSTAYSGDNIKLKLKGVEEEVQIVCVCACMCVCVCGCVGVSVLVCDKTDCTVYRLS